MVGMFQGTTVFNQNISTWNVQKINKTENASSGAGNARNLWSKRKQS